jgi:plastocyanin
LHPGREWKINNNRKASYKVVMKICISKIGLSSFFILAAFVIFALNAQSGNLFLVSKLSGIESVDYLVYGKSQSRTVVIPKGAASPEVDITKLTPTQWYVPSQISVNQNDTVIWINRDTEIHTVTSGIGAGLESLLNNKQGTKNGIFDSGIFKPGGNWTHKFVNPGVYTYFCTVHPWMEGTVQVKKGPSPTIPNYPVDATGQRQNEFPVHTLTKDNKYDIDLAWNPKVLITGEKVSFILDFSDPVTSKRHHLLSYDFVLSQNGNELVRKSGLSQVGSDVQEFIFSKVGPINIGIENVGDNKGSFTNFNSTVYENPNISGLGQQPQQPEGSNLPTNPFKVNTLTLIWITYTVIAVIPAAVAVVYILYRKRIL